MMNKTDFSFIRYSNCWEDTNILLKALDIKEGQTGISIASAGDNTLAMLLKNPKRIYAFDINDTQLFCCELKMACFKCLDYNRMLTLLGVCDGDRISLYKIVRHHISDNARTYFDNNLHIILNGIIHAGKFEHFFDIFRSCMIPLFSSTKSFKRFTLIKNLDKQLEFYQKHINTNRLKLVFKIYFGYKVMGKLGRDRNFYNYVDNRQQSGDDIRKRFEFGISNTPNAYNPYINYIVFGNFKKRCLPVYLKRENFEKIRDNIDRITLIKSDLLSLDISEKVDFANISDIFEYMSNSDFEINALKLAEITKCNSKIAYWNMQSRRYIDNFGFNCNKELSDKLFRQNNSWFYRDFLVYERTTAK